MILASSSADAAQVWKSTFDSTPDGVVDIKNGNSAKVMIGPASNGHLQITTMDNGTDAFTPDKAGRPLGTTVGPTSSFSGLYQFDWSTVNHTETQAYEMVGFLGNTTVPQTRQVLGTILRHWQVTNTNDYYVGVDLAFGSTGFSNFGYSAGPSTYLGGTNPEGNVYQLAIGYDGTTQTLSAGLYDATGAPLIQRSGTLSSIITGSSATAKTNEINAMSLTHLGWEDYSANLTDQTTVWQNDTLTYYDTADGARNNVTNLLAKNWNIDANGNWSVPGNWNPAGEPNGPGAAAVFGSIITSPHTVSIDNADKTVGALTFDNANSYTLTGPFAVLLNSPTGTGTITVASGSHEIQAPITVASTVNNTVVNVVQPSSTLTISGSIAETGVTALTKTGSGTLSLTGPLTYTGDTVVTGGKLSLGTNLTTTANVNVTGATLELTAGGGSSRVLRAASVAVGAGGRIDIHDNKLITQSPVGTANAGVYNGVTGLIQSGRNGGGWNGSGIVTSQSSATSGNFTSIGVATARQVKGLANSTDTTTFAGQTVTGTDTLVMYTYGGDANLDGKINVDDYGRIDSSIPLGIAGWYNGDFNYDGKINVDDYGIIDSNIGTQGAPFPTAGSASAGLSAVPEPGSLAAAGLVMLGALCGRRSRASRRRRAGVGEAIEPIFGGGR